MRWFSIVSAAGIVFASASLAYGDEAVATYRLEAASVSDITELVEGDSYFTVTLATAFVGENIQNGRLKNWLDGIVGNEYYAIPRGVVTINNRTAIVSNIDDSQRSSFTAEGDPDRIQVYNRYLVGPVPYERSTYGVEFSLFAAKHNGFIDSFLDLTSELVPVLDSLVPIPGVSASVVSNAQGAAETINVSIDNLIQDSSNGTLLMGYGTDQAALGIFLQSGYTAHVFAQNARYLENREYRLVQTGTSEFELGLETRKGENDDWEIEENASYMVLRVDLNRQRTDVEAIRGYAEHAADLRGIRNGITFLNVGEQEGALIDKVAEFDTFLRNSPDLTLRDGREHAARIITENVRFICQTWANRGIIAGANESSSLDACRNAATLVPMLEDQAPSSLDDINSRYQASIAGLEQLRAIQGVASVQVDNQLRQDQLEERRQLDERRREEHKRNAAQKAALRQQQQSYGQMREDAREERRRAFMERRRGQAAENRQRSRQTGRDGPDHSP